MDRRHSSLSSTSRKTHLSSIFTTQTTGSESSGSTVESNRPRTVLDNSISEQRSNVSSALDDSTLLPPSIEVLKLDISTNQSDDEVARACLEDEDALRAATARDTAQVQSTFQQTGQLLDDLDGLLDSDQFHTATSSSPNASTEHPTLRARVSRFLFFRKKPTRPDNEIANPGKSDSENEINDSPLCSLKSDVDTFVEHVAAIPPRHTAYSCLPKHSYSTGNVEHSAAHNTSTLHVLRDDNVIPLSSDATAPERMICSTSTKTVDLTYGPRITQQVFDELLKQQSRYQFSATRRSERSQKTKKKSEERAQDQGLSPTMWAQS